MLHLHYSFHKLYLFKVIVILVVNVCAKCMFYSSAWADQSKQIDILISKNQALQILYLKHCVYNNETT